MEHSSRIVEVSKYSMYCGDILLKLETCLLVHLSLMEECMKYMKIT